MSSIMHVSSLSGPGYWSSRLISADSVRRQLFDPHQIVDAQWSSLFYKAISPACADKTLDFDGRHQLARGKAESFNDCSTPVHFQLLKRSDSGLSSQIEIDLL